MFNIAAKVVLFFLNRVSFFSFFFPKGSIIKFSEFKEIPGKSGDNSSSKFLMRFSRKLH